MAAFGLTFILTRSWLPTLYIPDNEVISLASSLLIFAAIFQIFDGTQATALGVLRGLTDVKVPMIMSFVAYWVIAIPLGYYLGIVNELKANGVWISLTLSLVLTALFFTYRIYKNIDNYSFDK
jgi:MATE family multidrug resistance protein